MDQTLSIQCQGATTLGLDELQDLQGNLKDLTEENYVKLRNSIAEFGFSFPIFFWQDSEGKKWIIDAHQRVRTLKQMREEGWTIPPLPADPIFAESKAEAKKKLLLLNSRYGKIQLDGYEEFLHEEGAEIQEAELIDLIAIPDIELWSGSEEQTNINTETEIDPQKLAKDLNMHCPKCGFVFKGEEGLQATKDDEQSA